MKTLWEANIEPRKDYPALDQQLQTEVCIVGGGITGLTAALQLCRAGLQVVLLEAETLGFGTTGSSSNHLNTQIDYSYRKVEKSFSQEVARLVALSRREAIDFIERNVREYQIDCDFKRIDGYLYTEREDEIETLVGEFEASVRAGLAVEKTTETSLPFPVKLAVRYPNQGAFNSLKYLQGIAAQVEILQGRIFEHSRVIDFDRDVMTIKTALGSVKAKHVFLATHIPLFVNLHQTTCTPWRSYLIALKVDNYPQDALYWDMFDPYHYTRIYEQDGQKWLVIGGADHKTGHADKEKDYYKDLEAYAHFRYNIQQITHRWSQQYFEPSDGLPYIGLSPFGSTYMATGFSGDGLVYGTVAGMLVADMIKGLPSDWQKAFDPRRFKPIASAQDFIKHNIDVVKHLVADRFTSDDFTKLEPGQGVVVRREGQNHAIARDAKGNISICSAVCTHMGCIISWNHMDMVWECACHGSQFAPDGKVIAGPATDDLERLDQPDPDV